MIMSSNQNVEKHAQAANISTNTQISGKMLFRLNVKILGFFCVLFITFSDLTHVVPIPAKAPVEKRIKKPHERVL